MEVGDGKKTSCLKKIQRMLVRILGIGTQSPYVNQYFDNSNAHSSLIVSTIIILLETWIITSLCTHIITGSKGRTPLWITQHLTAYLVLLLSAAVFLVFNICFLKKKSKNHKPARIYTYSFALICLTFGTYISYLDYLKGEQVLAFVTMEVFVFGFFIWKPVVSFLLMSLSFLSFYFFCTRYSSSSYATNVNLFTTWIALFFTTINIYNQKLKEAIKSENIEGINIFLENLSVTDKLTGLSNMYDFYKKTTGALHNLETPLNSLIFLYLDIENFKNCNKKSGFELGDKYLCQIAKQIRTSFQDDIVARFSDDHFVVFTDRTNIFGRIEKLKEEISKIDEESNLGLKTGAYAPTSRTCDPVIACDKARYACNSIKKKFDKIFCEYTQKTDDEFRKTQYIINNIDKALNKGYIMPYYQPVVLSENKKLCGFEALARWIDPTYGMISPADFIPVLEDYRQIHKIDKFIVERVCADIFEAPSKNIQRYPVSVNFSRLDFELMDVAQVVKDSVEKYGLDKKYIHIEVTESALSDNDTKLRNTLKSLHDDGYSIWLDDFGSGYSGLNILKEFDFEMMKIDMKFLKNFSANKKAAPILRNIVTLAKDIGMQSLTEGVETEDVYEFLKSIGCERIQGYLFGKPQVKEEIIQKIQNAELKL